MSSSFNKNYAFSANIAGSAMNLITDQLKVALTDTAPTTATALYANISSPIAGTNLSGATPFNVSTTSWTQATGTAKLICAQLTLTATGSVGPFRYIVLYDDTVSYVTKPVIGWYDYGSEVTLNSGDTFTVGFDQSNGVITIA